MLRYIYARDLPDHPRLSDSMFTDRATQFRDRLGWDVAVTAQGHERDSYDAQDPLYVIWVKPDGRHGGSMRFLPTTGPTMVNDYFSHVMQEQTIRSPHIWECTRFCLCPKSDPRIAALLMLAGGEIMRGFGLSHLVGVFDARMVRVYRMIGSSPVILGSQGAGRAAISVGLWRYGAGDRARVLQRAGVSSQLSEHWFARAFGVAPQYLLRSAA